MDLYFALALQLPSIYKSLQTTINYQAILCLLCRISCHKHDGSLGPLIAQTRLISIALTAHRFMLHYCSERKIYVCLKCANNRPSILQNYLYTVVL